MGAIKAEVLQIKDEIYQGKAKIEKYRLILVGSFYWEGALLLAVFFWIFFPPEEDWRRLLSNSCFTLLLFSLWMSYRIINKIKSKQQFVGELRIKLRQMVWGKICDCEKLCDCKGKMEREMAEEYDGWSDGILAEVKHEV